MGMEATHRLEALFRQIEQCCLTAGSCAAEARAILEEERPAQQAGAGSSVQLPRRRPRQYLEKPLVDPCTMRVLWHGRSCAPGHTTLFRLLGRLVRHPNTYV